jgi:hypothetical protein
VNTGLGSDIDDAGAGLFEARVQGAGPRARPAPAGVRREDQTRSGLSPPAGLPELGVVAAAADHGIQATSSISTRVAVSGNSTPNADRAGASLAKNSA